jgi:butyryl-CoA dehydrogenase
MDFHLTEEQEMLRDMCRKFADNELKPKAEHYDRTHEFPWEHVKKLGEMGLMGVVYPPEYNGSGMDYVSYAIAVEEVSRGDASAGIIVSLRTTRSASRRYTISARKRRRKNISRSSRPGSG